MSKRTIMTGIFNGLLGCMLLLSCTISQSAHVLNEDSQFSTESENTEEQPIELEKKYNVIASIDQHAPYCGGAAPGPEQLNRFSNYATPLIAINTVDQTKTDMWMNGGSHCAYLPPGKYVIKEKFKDVPLKDFIQNNSHENSSYYQNGTEECFKNWKNSNLFEFEILSQDTLVNLSTTVGASCFTGTNPCIHYNGPYPP